MDSIIDALNNVFSWAIGAVATVAQTVTQTPLLLLFVIVSLVGLGVGMLRRLIRL